MGELKGCLKINFECEVTVQWGLGRTSVLLLMLKMDGTYELPPDCYSF